MDTEKNISLYNKFLSKIKLISKVQLFLATLMFKTNLFLGIIYWIVYACIQIIPLINVWLAKLILDELNILYESRILNNKIWIFIGIVLGLQIISSLMGSINTLLRDNIRDKAKLYLEKIIMDKTANVDMSFFDNPQNTQTLMAVESSETYVIDNMTWAVEDVIAICTFISGLIIFLSNNFILGLLYIITYFPGSIISIKYQKKMDKWALDKIPQQQKRAYYYSLLTRPWAAKDLRIYNLSDYYKKSYHELYNAVRKERAHHFRVGSISSFLASILTYVGVVFLLFYSIYSVINGNMVIGTLAFYIGIAQTTGSQFNDLTQSFFTQSNIVVPHIQMIIDFINYENLIKNNGKENVSGNISIEFIDVTFYYPNSSTPALDRVSFIIESGKKVALVGVNGSGKTTIIRLLLRFYEPQSGEILLAGKPLASYSLNELYKIFSVCFQDIATYALSVRENVAISDISDITNDKKIYDALLKADVNNILDHSDKGLDENLTRLFSNDGLELSGGQWQKIALARAFFRNSASFVILDEPTSALDPEAEDHIFKSFKILCKNKGGILISHRLSNIMMVDEIILIENGILIESGTHNELINKNGRYNELYKMQSSKYIYNK